MLTSHNSPTPVWTYTHKVTDSSNNQLSWGLIKSNPHGHFTQPHLNHKRLTWDDFLSNICPQILCFWYSPLPNSGVFLQNAWQMIPSIPQTELDSLWRLFVSLFWHPPCWAKVQLPLIWLSFTLWKYTFPCSLPFKYLKTDLASFLHNSFSSQKKRYKEYSHNKYFFSW